jgi:hypothetical protein
MFTKVNQWTRQVLTRLAKRPGRGCHVTSSRPGESGLPSLDARTREDTRSVRPTRSGIGTRPMPGAAARVRLSAPSRAE